MVDPIRPESRPDYKKDPSRRPWKVGFEAAQQLRELAPKWLSERSGIVVYENQMFDSSSLGDTCFMPVQFVAQEDDQVHWAPLEHRPDGGLPSRRQQQVDLVELADCAPEEGKTAVETAIAKAFVFETEAPKPRRKR